MSEKIKTISSALGTLSPEMHGKDGNTNKRGWMPNPGALFAAAILILILTSAAGAQVIDHSLGFAAHADLEDNGTASFPATVARLTTGGFGQSGSVFSLAKVCVQSFNTTFTFQYTPGTPCCGAAGPFGADGITFAMQTNAPTALGGGGGGLGYFGMPNSAAVKLDTFNNIGEGINSTGFFSGGAVPLLPAFAVDPVHLYDTDVKRISLSYDGTTLVETITDTVTLLSFSHTYSPIDIPLLVGGNLAHVGFTGGTGAATSTQDIKTWTFDNPPVIISGVSVDKAVLWPPNHTMETVTVNYSATGCGAPACTLSVSSNEPIDGLGDGDTSPDWVIVDAHHVQLRAERGGTGTGRIYTIVINCTDIAGNVASSTVAVTVPHDQKN